MGIFSKDWWQQRKIQKQLALKKEAREKLEWAMVDDTPKSREAACKAVLRALRAGVDLNANDPLWTALDDPNMERAMEKVCKRKRYKYSNIAKWILIGAGCLVAATAISCVTAGVPFSAFVGTILGKIGLGSFATKLVVGIGSVFGFGCFFGGAHLIEKHSTDYNKDVWANFLSKIRRKKGKGGGGNNGNGIKMDARDINNKTLKASKMKQDLYEGEKRQILREAIKNRVMKLLHRNVQKQKALKLKNNRTRGNRAA